MTLPQLEPMSLLLLLFFLMALLALLSLWFLLTLPTRRAAADEAEEAPRERAQPRPPREVPSNDELRGARVQAERRDAKPEAKRDEDLFERFLRAKNDELDF